MNKENVIELKQEPTTIWIKKGTKKMLDELGNRKDSYDDIIRKLINADKVQNKEPVKQDNRLKINYEETRQSTISLDNQGNIDFIYVVPKVPLDDFFRLKITYIKISYKNKDYKIYEQYKENRKELAKDYLNIVEKIIKQHIDPLFKIDQKRVLDLDWWERMFKNMGFPNQSFESDIKFELIKLGITP